MTPLRHKSDKIIDERLKSILIYPRFLKVDIQQLSMVVHTWACYLRGPCSSIAFTLHLKVMSCNHVFKGFFLSFVFLVFRKHHTPAYRSQRSHLSRLADGFRPPIKAPLSTATRCKLMTRYMERLATTAN